MIYLNYAANTPLYEKGRRLALSTLRIVIGHPATTADIEGFLVAYDTCYQERGR